VRRHHSVHTERADKLFKHLRGARLDSSYDDEMRIFRTNAGGIGCGAMCLGSQEASSGLRACSQDLVEEGVAEGEFSRIADEPVTHFVHHVPVSDAGVWIGESE